MPENIQQSASSGVMPYALCTAFSEWREYAQLQAQYHDGTTERSQLASPRAAPSSLRSGYPPRAHSALKAFWDSRQGSAMPFVFYNLIEGAYDPTGNSSTGRYTVAFKAPGRR